MASIDYRGFKITLLPDDRTRETVRIVLCGYLIGALLKNGNVAIKGLALDEYRKTDQRDERISFILYRLKLISRDDWEADHRKYELAQFDMSLASLEHDAEVLGYRVVKMRPPKKVKI